MNEQVVSVLKFLNYPDINLYQSQEIVENLQEVAGVIVCKSPASGLRTLGDRVVVLHLSGVDEPATVTPAQLLFSPAECN